MFKIAPTNEMGWKCGSVMKVWKFRDFTDVSRSRTSVVQTTNARNGENGRLPVIDGVRFRSIIAPSNVNIPDHTNIRLRGHVEKHGKIRLIS